MNLANLMHREIETVSAELSLEDAAKRMAELDVGMLVVSSGNELVGTLTDRDIVVQGIARGRTGPDARVQDAMSPRLVTCEVDAPVETAAKAMQTHQVRRLIVTEAGRAVGVLSLGDLASQPESEELAKQTLSACSR